MPIVDAGEVQLDCERGGEGPPLLLVMGMSGTKEHWGKPFLDALQADFETIVYDHRGVGRSSRVERSFTISDLARDAHALLTALQIERAHVLGISMGGMVAQELVLAEPELPLSLTLGCTYCGGEGSALAGEDVIGFIGQALASRDRERAIRANWEVNVSQRYASNEEAWQRFHAIGLSSGVAVAVILEQMKAISEHDTSARLSSIDAPTLVIHGEEDRMLPVKNGRMIGDLIPESHYEELREVGHLFFWERPEHVAELVRAHAAVHAG
ncbi:MAG: alpha/beta fold hydrolase [Solirubrobacteraceae bacterium]